MSKLEYDPLLSVIANPLASSRPNVVQDALNWEKEQLSTRVEQLEREKKQLQGSNEKLRHANKHYRGKIEALEAENKEYHDASLESVAEKRLEIDQLVHALEASKEDNKDLRRWMATVGASRQKQIDKLHRAKKKRDEKIQALEEQLGELGEGSEKEIGELKDLLELASMAHEDQEQKLTRFETSYEGLQGQLEKLAFRSRMYQNGSVRGCSSVSDTLDEILLEH